MRSRRVFVRHGALNAWGGVGRGEGLLRRLQRTCAERGRVQRSLSERRRKRRGTWWEAVRRSTAVLSCW